VLVVLINKFDLGFAYKGINIKRKMLTIPTRRVGILKIHNIEGIHGEKSADIFSRLLKVLNANILSSKLVHHL